MSRTVAEVTAGPVLAHLEIAYVDQAAWIELDGCQICGRSESLIEIGRVEGSEEVGPVLGACVDCEHGFMRRRPSVAWFDTYYAATWDRGGREGIEKRRVKSTPKVLAFCGDALDPGARVLDAGAGFGRFLVPFVEAGFQVRALERSEHRAGFLRDVIGVPCDSAALEDVELDEQQQLVFINHVLEHIDDPAQALAHVRRLLADDGLVYIAVPNLAFEYAPQSLHFVPHLSNFTLRSLTRLLGRNGFEPLKALETRELQILARVRPVAADQDATGASDRYGFEARLGSWLTDGFGAEPGERVLTWHSAAGGLPGYDSQVRPAADAPYRKLVKWHERQADDPQVRERLEARGRGWLAIPSLRMLPLRMDSAPSLPLTVRHSTPAAPIWIK
jgi:2-polyprenyl-3-methyl-5-hydroxy-6-metoxy-1,4-benzoquinol methylase